MNTYLIERTNKKTGESETYLVEAESLSLAMLEQKMKHGKGYTHRLVGHMTETIINDNTKRVGEE